MPARADRLARGLGAVRLDHRGGGIVHAHHHRRRAARLSQTFDDLGGIGERPAGTPDLEGADQSQQARLRQRIDRLAREPAATIHRIGSRGDHGSDHRFELGEIEGLSGLHDVPYWEAAASAVMAERLAAAEYGLRTNHCLAGPEARQVRKNVRG